MVEKFHAPIHRITLSPMITLSTMFTLIELEKALEMRPDFLRQKEERISAARRKVADAPGLSLFSPSATGHSLRSLQ